MTSVGTDFSNAPPPGAFGPQVDTPPCDEQVPLAWLLKLRVPSLHPAL